MAYLLSDKELVSAARGLNRAQEDEGCGGDGIPCYLFVLLSVSDDTRAKLVADPNWIMEDHSDDPNWEEAQEAYATWDEIHESWVARHIEKCGNDWSAWVQPVREFVESTRLGVR